MGEKQILIKEGIKAHFIETDLFKTNLICVILTTKLERDTVTKNALIPFLLRRGTNNLKTQTEINKKLEEMYGATYDCGIDKIGDNQALKFFVETINDKYTLSKEKDLNSGTIDYKKILAKLNETKERYSPKQMAQVAQDAIAQSKQTKEQLTTESLLAILEKQTAKNIDDGAVKQFNEDLAYLRSEGFIPPKSPDFEL